MPNAGDLVTAYSRQYKFIKPSNTEPGAYRLATPPDAAHGGSIGGGGGLADIDAVAPIATQKISTTKAEVSFDITLLPYI